MLGVRDTEEHGTLKKIKIEMDSYGPPYERCCFCREETPFWAVKENVACCALCSEKHTESELPTKDEWFEAEKLYDEKNKRH